MKTTSGANSKDKIKVLRIIARLNMGGPAMHVMLLNSGLDNKRFSSYLVTGTVAEGERDVAHMARRMGVEPLFIPELQREIRPISDFRAFVKLCKLMKELRPDIVHTHTAKAGALGRLAAILNRVPVKIHTFHGHVFHSYFGNLKTSFFIAIEKMLAGFTDKIIAISKSQLEDLKKSYRIAAKDKAVLIPLGLDLGPFLNIPEKAPSGRLKVGIIGRLVKVKNHRLFLDAAKIVKDKAPDLNVDFVIVGDGGLKAELVSYARKLKIDKSVIFTGWREDLSSIYGDLDIVCLTSLNEGTPISLIEALAAARPVVSTDVGGVRDVVRHSAWGLLSPAGDAGALSGNLLSLLRDSERRRRLGQNGREFVRKTFSKERLIKDMEKLYEEELQKRGVS